MKDRVVTSVHSISTIHIRADQESFTLVCTECVCLVRRSVCSQERLFIEVVSVCSTSAGVVFWEAKRVEVLVDCDYRKEVVVIFVRGKAGFNEASCNGDWMIWLEVEAFWYGVKD